MSYHRIKLKELSVRQYGYWKCFWCGCQLENGDATGVQKKNTLTVDHIIPRCDSRSKDLGISNLVLSCATCNNDRGTLLNYIKGLQDISRRLRKPMAVELKHLLRFIELENNYIKRLGWSFVPTEHLGKVVKHVRKS